jgi:hypothetical protein
MNDVKSPLQVKDIDLLTEERAEALRKEIGADGILIASLKMDSQSWLSSGICPHELIYLATEILTRANNTPCEEEHTKV